MEIPQLFRETRYGMPSADQILPNRGYLIGYSYLFRQPRWGMHIIKGDDTSVSVGRDDCFRPDWRIPEQFRADLSDYKGSGYDRGHVIPSADRLASRVENSETFLLTNMAPQSPEMNRQSWRILEQEIRKIARRQNVVEVYSIGGPVFDISKPFKKIGDDVVVPHAYFKTVLVESNSGKFEFYSFLLPNDDSPKEDLNNYLVSLKYLEFRTGLLLWDKLRGSESELARKRINKIAQ
jgi:endonuclease G, mitochondrial